MLDWQMNFLQAEPLKDTNVIDAIEKVKSDNNLDLKTLRRKRFIVELNAKKQGRVIERPHSVKKEMHVIKHIERPEIPDPKKKVV